MHRKRLSLNTISALLLEIVTIICGFILPRLIIRNYGSDVNGLINSIKQFLSAITFLEFGIGAVIRSALYKPLAENDERGISEIMSSAGKFYRNIGKVLAVYVCVLIAIYPIFSRSRFSRLYITVMILVLSINSFAQYFVGCVDKALLTSDQRGYIQSITYIIAIVSSTITGAVLIQNGFGIHIVQFVISVFYMIRPFGVRLYIKRNYSIDYHIKYKNEPISQKWNGIAQHIAYMILESTDIIVLTLFSTLSSVSVYSVYFLVVRGIKQLFLSICDGFQALMGEFYARKDMNGMKRTFDFMEWLYGTMTTFVFGCAAFLIVPFVYLYTLNINDADYNQPFFAIIILLAYWIFSNNLPYHTAILAAGHYRQTQKYFIMAAAVNLIISVVAVHKFGLVGVAVGTVAAMLFQTTWMIIYNVKHISKRPVKLILKQFAVDGIVALVSSILSSFVCFDVVSWIGWLVMAIKIAIIWGGVSLIINAIVYYKLIRSFILRSFEVARKE